MSLPPEKMTDDDLRILRLLDYKGRRSHWTEVLPSIVSGFTVMVAIVGFLWSFALNQEAHQVLNGEKLDRLATTLAEVRRNSDHVPLMQMQLDNIEARQKSTEEAEKKTDAKMSEISEALVRLGVRTK